MEVFLLFITGIRCETALYIVQKLNSAQLVKNQVNFNQLEVVCSKMYFQVKIK